MAARASRVGLCLMASVAAAGAVDLRAARAIDLFGIQPAALDQPQINAILYAGNSTTPLIGQSTDPLTGDPVSQFNVQAFLDTGASSILISSPTASVLNVPLAFVGSTPVLYSDVGAVGSDTFQVSTPVRLSLANYYPRTDLDQFQDAGQTIPITTPYTPLPAPNTSVQVEVGPYRPTVDNPGQDDVDQLIQELTDEENAVDVIGMPAIKGHVMVIDPSGVKPLGSLFGVLGDVVNGTGDPGDISDADLQALETAGVHTFLYAPGTPYHPNSLTTDPGIPATQLHVQLSYGTFDRFTSVTPAGAIGPTLEHNPFIGKDPVKLLDGTPQPDVPGIKITRSNGSTVLSSEGNWLLDTGAAASIISEAQASNLGVTYETGHGPGSPDTADPILVDQNNVPLPDQFTLVLGGVGGQETLAGFYLDSMLVRTMEGSATDDNNPLNLHFTQVPVLVGDITLKDPNTNQTITLDGIFGMNNLIQSINIQTDNMGNLTDIGAPSPSFFQWVTFDEPNGILGLSLDPTAEGQTANWNGTAGNWSDATMWSSSPQFPNNASITISGFDVVISGGTVNLDVSPTINSLTLSGGSLTGSGNLTLLSGGTVTGSYNLTGTTTVFGGTLLFSSGVQHAGPINGGGAVVVSAGAQLFSQGISLDTLEVDGAVTIAAGSGAAGTSKVNTLIVANSSGNYSGKLDLADNKLIEETSGVDDRNAKVADLNAAITSGSNSGAWNGNGITSSTAAANAAHYGIGVFDNAILGRTSFGGVAVDPGSLLVGLAHLGDANDDGVVDLQDLSVITNNWQQARDNWAQGDLNRDGVVDLGDLSIVTNNWQQTSSFGLEAASAAVVAVPEPASLALLVGGAGLMMWRRGRRSRGSQRRHIQKEQTV